MRKWTVVWVAALILGGFSQAQAQCVAEGYETFDLLAGKTEFAGLAYLRVETGNLVLAFHAEEEWELMTIQLWAGTDKAAMPQTKKGNPKVGKFPYKIRDLNGADMCEVWVPLDTIGVTELVDDTTCFIAAHAVMRKELKNGRYEYQGAWGDGERMVPRGNWATLSATVLTANCGEDDPVDETLPPPSAGLGEPAFGQPLFFSPLPIYCFVDDPVYDFQDWGWSMGPITDFGVIYSFNLNAGGSDCSSGDWVGSAYLTMRQETDSSGAPVLAWTVEYEMNSPYTLLEAQVYIGADKYPVVDGNATVSPADYPYQMPAEDSGVEDAYTLSGTTALSEDVYIIIRAGIGGFSTP